MTKRLCVYPTSRALRAVSEELKASDGLLPSLLRMDAFESRAVLVEGRAQIDPLKRILLLQKAARFEAFEQLNLDRSLIRFFSKSDAIFKFFEELAAEEVSFQTLAEADAYAEFGMHLAVLEQLLENYRHLLDAGGFTDRAFIPEKFRLNDGFIEGYRKIEIYLEGYLSRFELSLLSAAAEKTELIVHYNCSRFNRKMQERFAAYGLQLPPDHHCSFSISSKEILSREKNSTKIHSEVYAVEERVEQVSLAFAKIEEMVESGIAPEKIVLLLPDEQFKKHFALFDRHHNLNFAMGYDYSEGKIYKSLKAIYNYWQRYDPEEKLILERYGVEMETIEKIAPSQKGSVEAFFAVLERIGLFDLSGEERGGEKVEEKYRYFSKIFAEESLSLKEWLFLWLKALSKLTIDDVRGGLITVMGVLETRGVSYEGVVIVDFNDGVVPAASSKDQFLNSSVRTFAGLPTREDREALQKQYYKRLLEKASRSVVIYSRADNRLPSKFLYELGLEEGRQATVSHALLYGEASQIIEDEDPVVENFDACALEWSASRLKIWLECTRRYYYRYIRKIESKKENKLIEGVFLHTLLERLYRERSSYGSEEEIGKKIDMLLGELLPDDDAEISYKKLLWREKLRGFMTQEVEHFSRGWSVVEREREYRGEIGGLRFKGRIDRIDRNDTRTLVIDYKSGSTAEANRVKNLETLSDFQMSIYHAILRPKYPNLSLVFMKILEKGEKEEITALEEKNELLGKQIAVLKQTSSFAARKCEDLKKCKYCEFALICERGEYL